MGIAPFAAHRRHQHEAKLEFRDADARCLEIGLINNMTDAALETTERQVLKVLDAAAEDVLVRLRLYSLPDLPRTGLGKRHLTDLNYLTPNDLCNTHLDGVIITGTEPRTSDLTTEPYWSSLTEVFEWAQAHTASVISSCLAVHAAVLHLDGIGRYPLHKKCFGIFDFANVSLHPMMKGMPPILRIPHSRWNEVRECELSSCGYIVLSRSGRAGVDMFVKQRRNLLLFFQGHPEYEAWTLFREYRRDVERFLNRERDTYPDVPVDYFGDEEGRSFERFKERALIDRNIELLDRFPNIQAERIAEPWRSPAILIYRNWLLYLSTQKARRLERLSAVVR